MGPISGTAPTQVAPDGLYYVHLGVFEYEPAGSCGNTAAAYCIDDVVEFTSLLRVSGGVYTIVNPAAPITPQAGVWGTTGQAGTGYGIVVQHGVLVMTMYTFNPDGSPMWYLATGTLVNNSASMDLGQYRNGQCMSCATYPGAPTYLGSGGTALISFTSTTSAVLSLPGGRNVAIVPISF
jgi:hypothetical protein